MTARPPATPPLDRWLELDLYWFNRDDIAGSAGEFWERYAPLFQNVSGWKGVVLCVGWLMDYITEWQARPGYSASEKFLPLVSLRG